MVFQHLSFVKHARFAEDYNKWNTLLGWFSFLVALIVYFMTVEPTGSFWDAGEYITTSAKLQVGHPPGAPLLQMIGAFFALFAFGNEMKVALMINSVSVVSSAFAVLFAYWIITNLLKKLIVKEEGELSKSSAIVLLGSGLIGALAFTFSDSFWFNAVETEVYAMASFIMALLFWLGLKWTDNLDDPRGHRWLLLICFVIGLVFGIQFMGFLAIPSIGLLYFFKKYPKPTWKQFLIGNAIVVGLLFLVYKFSLTYVLMIFGAGEVFFVNQVGLPFNSGTLIVGLLFAGLFYWGIQYTQKKRMPLANLIVHCVLFLFLGFSSWLMLPIRANAQTVVNENNPEDARSLLAYYNREQYPGVESPFYGSYYSDLYAAPGDDKDDKPKYEKDHTLGKYVIVNEYKDALQGPNPDHVGLLPRMWSDANAENYMRYFGRLDYKVKSRFKIIDSDGEPVSPEEYGELLNTIRRFESMEASGNISTDQYIDFLRTFGEYIDVQKPSLGDNLRYMFDFQFGYMYVRYFMWNFVGRQNDIQGRYDGNGNWISGISAFDSMRIGSQKDLPSDQLSNKGRNTYFFLPFILGLIGIVYQVVRNPKQFWILLVYFLFTGLAIQFYTNPPIFQPRERDYSLVGSFFIYCLWIGMGVYALFTEIRKRLQFKWTGPAVIGLTFLAVPFLMAYQNWDDHDRSGRKTARSTAMAYLSSTKKDAGAILFTIGDNDTFPLWYVQEIEKFRTDVRVVNTSLFATDWYIDQMKRQAYESAPIPSQLTHDKYRFGTRDAIYYQGLPGISEKRWDLNDFMDWVGSDKPQTRLRYWLERRGADLSQYPESNLNIIIYPTNKIRVPVNKANVLASGLVKPEDADQIVDYIDIDLPKGALPKNRILMLDILANNDWKRPIYFSGGSFDKAEYIWMKDYLQLDGLVYKLVPIKTKNPSSFEMGRIDSDLMYDIVMDWEWGNSEDPSVYHDPQTRSQGLSFRSNLARLSEQLIDEGKIEKAKTILDLAMKQMPFEQYGFYAFLEPYLDGYFKVGETEKARELFNKLKGVYQERLHYRTQAFDELEGSQLEDVYADLQAYRRNIDILFENQQFDWATEELGIYSQYVNALREDMGDDNADYLLESPLDVNLEDLMPEDSIGIQDTTALDSPVPATTATADSAVN